MRASRRSFLVAALLAPGVAWAQSNLVQMISPPGDYIGAGQAYLTTNLAEFSLAGDLSHVSVTFAGFWIEIDGPGPEDLAVGRYTGAVRYPFNDGQPGLSVWGNGRGCNTVCGEFEILEIEGGMDGQVERFWCTFSQSCECFMAALAGEIRYHSALAPAAPPPRTLRVPAEFGSIQAALDAARLLGDTILVGPGTYREALNFRGKRLLLASETGPSDTIVIPPADSTAVTFTGGEPRESELRGFTLRDAAGGILVNSSSPTLTGNVISNCVYGINCQFASPLIRSNRIVQSRGGGGLGDGSGIHLGGAASAVIEHNLIESNRAGLTLFAAGTPVIRDNVIRRNAGDGINLVNQSDADIIQNVIAENAGNGIAWLVPSGARGPWVQQNTIVANGQPGGGAGIAADGYDAAAEIVNNLIVGTPAILCGDFNDLNPPIIRFNNVYAPSGPAYAGRITDQTGLNGNLSAAPLFLDPGSSDYRLQWGSPGIDAGTADRSTALDLEGNTRPVDGDLSPPALPDLGAYEFVPGPPRPVTSISAVATATNIVLTWSPFDGATNFVLGRATNSGGPYRVVATIPDTEYVDADVEANRWYYYAVAGQNTFGTGAYSPETQIRSGNHPPLAAADGIETDEDQPALITPLSNDSDPDGDTLTLTLLTFPADGSLTQTNNSLWYVPPLNTSGTRTFEYRIEDGRGGVASAQVTIVVRAVNDPPVVGPMEVVVTADAPRALVLQGSDVDGDPLQFFLLTPPTHGMAHIAAATGELTYWPAHGFQGRDTLQYVAADGSSVSAPATIGLLVRAFADLDRDGMADEWENLWDLNSPLSDPDGDGVANRDEFIANTSPRDASSNLQLLQIGSDPGGGFRLSWRAVGGTRYRVRSCDALSTPGGLQFQEIARPAAEEIDPAPYGQSSVQVYIDPRPVPATGMRFYQIQVVF